MVLIICVNIFIRFGSYLDVTLDVVYWKQFVKG